MSDHPSWCEPGYACTADAEQQRSLRPAHRGARTRVEAEGGGSVVTALTQEVGQPPTVTLTAAGWGMGRTVDLDADRVQQLIDNLTEQLAAMRNAAAQTREAPRGQ